MSNQETQLNQYTKQILGQVSTVISGKDSTLLWVLTAILARGHILLEDIPGVGKTTMAVAFSKVLGLSCNRVQFTPDVLPSDITGYSIPDPATGNLRYQPGAVLCNLFLADELNRATSRTQSALLEAMEEGQVTVDGVRHKIPQPFTVMATQNPVGAAGTQLLPDSQMDRLALRLSLGYPGIKDELNMVMNRREGNPMDQLTPVLTAQELAELQDLVVATFLHEQVAEYVVALADATRKNEFILRGISPRATLSIVALAKATARLQGRDFVTPRDVQAVFSQAVSHRLQLSSKASGSGKSMQQILKAILEAVPAPGLN